MKTIRYKEQEIALNEEQEKEYGSLKSLKHTHRWSFAIGAVGLALSSYWGVGHNNSHKIVEELRTNHPVEYSKYIDASKELEVFDQLFLGRYKGDNSPRYPSILSKATPAEMDVAYNGLSKKVYEKVMDLKEKDLSLHDRTHKLRSELELALEKKKEPIKERLDEIPLNFLQDLSLFGGLVGIGFGGLFGVPAYIAHRLRRRKFLKSLDVKEKE